MPKVLLVDDDVCLTKMVADWLKSENFTVEVVGNGTDAKALISDFHYDLIVLDWNLPDVPGVNVLSEYRKKGGIGMVLMLTGRDQIAEKQQGFASGADDYLTKPFHIAELVSRLQAMMRRPRTVYQDELHVGDIRLNPQTRAVFVADNKVDLMAREFALLEHFMRQPGQVFDCATLLDRLWRSEQAVSEETVRTCVKRLRQKLAANSDKSHIETLYGAGYRLKT
ncbi:MAG TPA: response regulator transcription factor [Trichormus sp.]|jgi:DNA-binding response OmpR family regulator